MEFSVDNTIRNDGVGSSAMTECGVTKGSTLPTKCCVNFPGRGEEVSRGKKPKKEMTLKNSK